MLAIGPVGWGAQGGIGFPSGPTPVIGLRDLGLLDAKVHAFAATLQGVVAEGLVSKGVATALPSPSMAAPAGRIVTLLLLYPRFD